MNVTSAIHKIVRESFSLAKDFVIDDDLRMEDIPSWDSLGWVTLINTIEDHFHVELPLEELAEVTDIQRLRLLIKSQLHK